MVIIEENGKISAKELKELFLLLGWRSGEYEARLLQAVRRSSYYVTARDSSGELIGLISALDDSAINVYLPYVLVHPDYQRKGIGNKMMCRLKEHYRDFLRIALISYAESLPFYQANGFSPCEDQMPMEDSRFSEK